MGELALVGDHSTVPLTWISCNTVFSKSQNPRKAGTLCTCKWILLYYFHHDVAVNIFLVALWNDRYTNVFRSLKFNLNSQVKTLSVLVISKQISQIHIFHIWKMCQTKLLTLRFQKSIASQIQHGILGHFRWHTKKTLTILLDIWCSKLKKRFWFN